MSVELTAAQVRNIKARISQGSARRIIAMDPWIVPFIDLAIDNGIKSKALHNIITSEGIDLPFGRYVLERFIVERMALRNKAKENKKVKKTKE